MPLNHKQDVKRGIYNNNNIREIYKEERFGAAKDRKKFDSYKRK